MTAPSPEKAAPIPADVVALADEASWRVVREYRLSQPSMSEAIARAIMQDRADREARPSLPDSREERIREDEPTRFPAKAAYARAMDVADRLIERAYGTSMPDEWNEAYRDVQSAVARADRARQGGNNG